jgi:hypothetical protein
VGDDANPCSRTAPCKTFQGAISKTAAGGEINCIDPGGFGAVSITKSMTILCDDVEAGVLVSGSPGFTINAGVNDVVTISGIDLFGPTPSAGGTNGINFVNGGGLNLRHTSIKGFNTQAINFQPQTASAFLNVEDVQIIGNGTAGDATTGAIRIAPANNMTANVVIVNTRVQGNQNVGLRADMTGTTGTRVNVTVRGSEFSNDGTGMLFKAPASTGTVGGMIVNNSMTQNSGQGVIGNGPGVVLYFSSNTISLNTAGVFTLGGAMMNSFGDNLLASNPGTGVPNNGAFSSPVIGKQ